MEKTGVNLSSLTERLGEAGDDFQQLRIGDHASILVSALTARVYGPFFEGRDPIGWVAQAFGKATDFKNLRQSGDWNVGGERLWLSPELEYFVADRRDFWNTYAVPSVIDPGLYELSRIEGDGVCLSTAFDLRSARTGSHQAIRIERRIVPAPLSAALPPSVRTASYRQEISVDSASGEPPVVPWIIRQVRLGGEVRIPARLGAKASSIVGPLPEHAKVADRDGFVFGLDRGGLFKAAFAARDISPTIAYVMPAGDDICSIVLSFDGSADAAYFEEPPDRPGENGYSAFVFRDDGRFGGYAELEVVGRPVSDGDHHRKRSTLTLTTTVLLGPVAEVAPVPALASLSAKCA